MPGFRALLFDKAGALLVMRRADTGLWGLPSGSIELGESAEQMIEREVHEETGLRVGNLDIFGLASEPTRETHVYPNGDLIQNFSVLVASHDWIGSPVAMDGEATDFRFVISIDDLPAGNRVEQETRCLAAYGEYERTRTFQLL